MRKLFVSTTHWLADATDASVPSAAKASRRRALLQPSMLGDLPAQSLASQKASQVASWAAEALHRSCQLLQQAHYLRLQWPQQSTPRLRFICSTANGELADRTAP